jgi:hypothetical protein
VGQFELLVKGHDFSRADKVSKMSWALAPANPSLSEFAFHSDFFRSLFSRAAKAENRGGLQPLRDGFVQTDPLPQIESLGPG